ncbi:MULTISPECIES: DNA-directed RNA polymerase subunit omega [unclassified Sulfuricurvum]|uniref:DNA-directed RNA polymerase subunit omega n=1 Tax=unclassified Sulfuricurvum TaxID=2632390 RepID=UPI00029965D8|nr:MULTISPECIES: DNA-directed RNA polymerase subunit omega [unclassified Sulfuricurvum]OHD79807.1 MAG: DNA-directed RNA polymerase subunit omega [Sulfuricurvum sp. RIFCSPHIGHO2_02_FULL_43_9]OHD84251.1 MAG: DNA-directed RNA polymerase subunit omega [Sulfuricurvum sp. RIFCSPLOWO2_02_43_6]OHD86341.1 MAG: DNA-directed RNA polymerase subunit omega [Sulfuricurvum sp. RIFCSPLOWO2_02_FULL_43_45]OHD87800.1 MAG: DNA-directed RNA polymerase subunit omega [Sulfuricurvum sp. RIFCSPLOWO2_12_43_5]OHD88067.1 
MRLEQLTAKALETANIDRYQLAIAVAKRSEELLNGATTKLNVDVKKAKTADIALMEIAEGLISIKGFVPRD